MTGTFHHDDRLKISHGNLTKIMGTRFDIILLEKGEKHLPIGENMHLAITMGSNSGFLCNA